VPEDVAQALVASGEAVVPAAEDLCRGRFLVRRRAGMGDVLCLLPVVRAIQEGGGECAVACHPRYRGIWDGVAAIGSQEHAHWTAVNFDAVLEHHPGRKSQCAAQCYADRWNLDIEDARPRLDLTEGELAWGIERAATVREGADKLVAAFTGAGWGTRRYRGILKVSGQLAKDGYAVLGFGQAMPCCTKGADDLSIRQLASILAACDAVLTNDSGPLHLAAAVGTPCVAVFCATSAAGSVGPGYQTTVLEPKGLACWPCWQADCPKPDCVWGVDPKEVYEAVLAAI